MAELTAADVEAYTNGRLEDDGGDGETTDMLNAALTAARRFVGWHVSPVREGDEVTLDGPDSRILTLPTRKLIELTSIDEDEVSVDLTKLRWSVGGPPGISERPVGVRKKSDGFWSSHYQSILVVMDHGYTEAEAIDWRRAVMSLVDQMSLVPLTATGGFGEANLMRKTVDDVTYAWNNPYSSMAENALYSCENVLANYMLPRTEFL